ncbi:MAG TPA: hypothetical protein VGF30_13030 [Bacteroidia bacterium]
MISWREYGKYFLVTSVYYLAAFALLFTFLYLKENLSLFSNANFLNWDAGHYFQIKTNGYDAVNTAFFPLFPFVWKAFNFTPIGIGFLNFVLFMIAVSVLCAEMKLKLIHTLIVLSVPGLFFMFLPYAEALFFFCGTIALVGLKRDKLILTALGLFLCSLCRPTTFIFIPAILIVYYVNRDGNWKTFFTKTLVCIFVLLSGLFVSFMIQKVYTGQWLTFFDSQEKWGNKLGFPTLPLTTWGGDNILRYESTAVLIGIISGVVILLVLFNKRWKEKFNFPPEVLFSIAYLAGATAIVILYRGGLLFSLNRFIYATPFLLMALGYFLSCFSFTIKQAILVFVGIILFSALFASYSHIHNLLCFAVMALIMSGVLLVNNKSRFIALGSSVALILVNSIVAYHLVMRFLLGLWVA